jgi:hypothetical protein
VGAESGAPLPPDPLIVTLTTSDPSRLLLSRSQTTAGSASITAGLQSGSSYGALFLQALGDSGTVDVVIEAPGYARSISAVRLAPSHFAFQSASGSQVTTLITGSGNQLLPITLGAVVTSSNGVQHLPASPIRAGSPEIAVTVESSNPAAVAVETPRLVFREGESGKQVQIHAVAPGEATVRIVPPPGFAEAPNGTGEARVTVSLPSFTVSCPQQLAMDTVSTCRYVLDRSAAVTVVSPNERRLLFSTTQQGRGVRTITFEPATGGTFYIHALGDFGEFRFTVSAPGFRDATPSVSLVGATFGLDETELGGPLTVNAGSSRTMRVRMGTQVGAFATMRPGAMPVTVELTSSNTAVGRLSPASVAFGPGDSEKTFRFEALAAGSTIVRILTPPGSVPPQRDSLLVTVVQP